MSASATTHPDTIRREPASGFEPPRLEASRLEKCLGGALCLVALAAGVSAGLMLRGASARAGSLPERRAEVASLSAAEKDHLRYQYNRFAALPAEQQDRLRDFDAELAAVEDPEPLRGTLRRYHEWLRTIPPSDRNELLKLSDDPARKADRVEELSPLSREDAAAVEKWLKDCARARGHLREDAQLFWGPSLLMERPGDGRGGPGATKAPGGGGPRPLSEAEFAQLSRSLSKVRRARLAKESRTRDKRRLVLTWWQRRGAPSGPRSGLPSAEELVQFFTDDANDEVRRGLLAMTPDERTRELPKEYRRFERELERFFTDDLGEEARQRLTALPRDQRSRELRAEYHKFEAELKRFFAKELSEESRAALSELPPDQRNRKLREEYRKAKSPDEPQRVPLDAKE